MSGLAEIMDELGSTIRAATDAAFAGSNINVQVEPRMNFNPTPPSIDLYPGDPFRDVTTASFGDRGEIFFTVRARVDTAEFVGAQDVLLELMDDESAASVAVALEEDQTLNGLASSVKVDGPSAFGASSSPDNEGLLLNCTWRVTVLNART